MTEQDEFDRAIAEELMSDPKFDTLTEEELEYCLSRLNPWDAPVMGEIFLAGKSK